MSEIIFNVTEDEVDGGFVATALGHAIATQGDTMEELREMVRDAVQCPLWRWDARRKAQHYPAAFCTRRGSRSVRIPRDIDAALLIKALRVLGYERIRQDGSHIRLTSFGFRRVLGLVQTETRARERPLQIPPATEFKDFRDDPFLSVCSV